MRIIAAIAGAVVSILPLIFFWIGTQTFARYSEKALALAVTLETAALLLFSVALLFTPAVQHVQALLLVSTLITIVLILAGYRLLR